MKKIICILLVLITLSGCYSISDINSTERIKMLESRLSIDLDGLTDKYIKTEYSDDTVTIEYLRLEGAGEIITADLKNSYRWKELPLDEIILNRFDDYDYLVSIADEGFFTVSGIISNDNNIDFNTENIDLWDEYKIGIWDIYEEYLYILTIKKARLN